MTRGGALARWFAPALAAAGLAWPALAAPPLAAAAAESLAAPAAPKTVTLVDLDAIKQQMQRSRGRTLVVHFWATWCLPCLKELPVVNRFAQEKKAYGVDVLSLSLDDPRATARVAKVLGESAPALTRTIAKIDDPDAFIAQFDHKWAGAIPAMFVFDAQGHLRARYIGEATRPDLDGLIQEAALEPGVSAATRTR
ncbi:MAG TPA: TlpA disulfide reductase family protein [Polyangia bacterium]|nr:TlpA disulfide reductase family protein [Polyangia bacterium]